MKLKKRILFLLSFIIMLSITGCATKTSNEFEENITVNIGFIKTVSPAYLAKEKGFIEQQFAKKGAKVNWIEFQTGPEEFEAMSANHIDFLACGNTPVIVAQAAGIDFKIISLYSTGLKNNVVLIPKDSPMKSIQDLKDKKIAVAKGSTSYNLIYRTLDQAGLKPSDVKLIQLAPSEAKSAFENGNVDAWGIWEPFISTEIAAVGAKILVSGEDLRMPSPNFVVTSTKFAGEHPELVNLYLKALDEAVAWQENHLGEAVDLYASEFKLDKSIVENIVKNTDFRNDPMPDDYMKEHQITADTLYQLGGIKNKVEVAKVIDNTFITGVKNKSKTN